jgi:GNAT superfamily N-acetyltransferase
MRDGQPTATLEIALDGYTDLPPGKIANVVTFFEMTARPAGPRAPAPSADLSVRIVPGPTTAWYRDLYRRIGEDWLWFARAVMPDEQLAALLADPATEILALERSGAVIGFAEIHHTLGEAEIAMFGVVPEATGTRAARFLMERALDHAWGSGVGRVWLHTCSFDHPAAVRFYKRAGFRPYKFAIEVSDDPRLTGHLPETAGPHVALIKPD